MFDGVCGKSGSTNDTPGVMGVPFRDDIVNR